MSHIFFAACGDAQIFEHTFEPWDWENRPLNILITFPYLKAWYKHKKDWPIKCLMLDSGAYSAWNSGLEINIDELCAEAAKPEWDQVVALDVIGNPVKSVENAFYMKEKGLNVMPVFHFGEDWNTLTTYKENFDRVGLACGSVMKYKEKLRWLDQCFARAYPCSFHSFGWVKREVLLRYPFVTADTASWIAPVRYGKPLAMPNFKYPRVTEAGVQTKNITFEVEHYLRLEEEVQERWASELVKFPDWVNHNNKKGTK